MEGTNTDTLCQLFAGTTNPLTWMLHAGGIGKLVLARGPDSFQSSFEKALLRSARPMIVGETTPLPVLGTRKKQTLERCSDAPL